MLADQLEGVEKQELGPEASFEHPHIVLWHKKMIIGFGK